MDSGVVQLPHFRALVFGIPGLLGAPEGENPLLRSGFFLIPPAAAEGRRKSVLFQCRFQGLGLHDVRIGGAMVEGIDALPHAVHVGVHQHVQPIFFRGRVTKFDHLVKFPGGVDVKKRKWGIFGIESLSGKMQHDRAVLPDGVEHDGLFAFRGDLSHDVDGFRLQSAQVI